MTFWSSVPKKQLNARKLSRLDTTNPKCKHFFKQFHFLPSKFYPLKSNFNNFPFSFCPICRHDSKIKDCPKAWLFNRKNSIWNINVHFPTIYNSSNRKKADKNFSLLSILLHHPRVGGKVFSRFISWFTFMSFLIFDKRRGRRRRRKR